ncbi:MAG: hypothetical protein ACJAT1_000428 [Marivirga sp.]|jgi:hypothetical protein
MKLQLLTFFLMAWLISYSATAQSAQLETAYQHDVKIRKTGMLILGSWAVGNMLIGGIGRTQLSGEKAYFHEMNLIWNVVNLSIAGAGYYFTAKGELPASGAEQLASQISFQKTLLFNAGLDVAYIVGGLYLLEKSKNTANKPERLKGYGRSVVLQGSFLLAFDLILHTVHAEASTPLTDFMSHLSLGPQYAAWVYRF